MYYSSQTNGFYDPAINGNDIPADAVEITSDRYDELLAAQSAGQLIVPGDDGGPTVQYPPPPTQSQLTASAIQARDELLRTAAIRIAPLQDAVDIGEATAAEEQQLLAWKKYRVALNRITEQPGFPTVIEWPETPT